MSYGLRTWDEGGVLQMDTDSFTYQVLHSETYTLARSQVLTVTVAGFDPATCSAAILPISPPPDEVVAVSGAIPYVSVAQNTITIRSKHPSETGTNMTQLTFRLLVMRYK